MLYDELSGTPLHSDTILELINQVAASIGIQYMRPKEEHAEKIVSRNRNHIVHLFSVPMPGLVTWSLSRLRPKLSEQGVLNSHQGQKPRPLKIDGMRLCGGEGDFSGKRYAYCGLDESSWLRGKWCHEVESTMETEGFRSMFFVPVSGGGCEPVQICKCLSVVSP